MYFRKLQHRTRHATHSLFITTITFLFHVTHKINCNDLNLTTPPQTTLTKWRRDGFTAPGIYQNMALASRRVKQDYHYMYVCNILYKYQIKCSVA